MFVTMVLVAFVLLGDGLVLALDPASYRRCIASAEEMVGRAWPIINGGLFVIAGLLILIAGFYRATSRVLSCTGGILGVLGVLFILASRQDGRYLYEWLKSRSSLHYRAGGVLFVILGLSVLRGALEIR